VTLNGKPIDGAVVSLHKFLGPYSVEIGHADAHVLSETITTENGSFSLGEVPTGKYVIVIAKPSNEFTNVQLVLPKKGESDTVAIEYFADFCASATTISATGERLTPRSSPTILGIGSAGTQRR